MEVSELGPVLLVLLAGSLIQATAGFGLGMFAIPLLLWLGQPSWVAIPICVATTLVHASYGLARLRAHVDWLGLLRLAWLPALGVPVGVAAQAALIELGPTRTRQAYGALILAVLLLQIAWRVQPRERVAPGWSLAAMLGAGFMSGSAGMGGPPIVLWVMAHRWSNERSRTAIWLLFVCMAAPVTALLWLRFGPEVPRAFGTGLLIAPVALLSFVPGLWLGRRIPVVRLRQLAHLILGVISVAAIVQPALGAQSIGSMACRDRTGASTLRRAEVAMILEGKTIVVVGVGDGLGAEVARLALRDGARVMLAARTEKRLEEMARELDPSGERVVWQATDITDAGQCAALARATTERLGPPDAVACVAALDASFGDLRSTDAEQWRRTHEINVIGTTQIVRAFADEMSGRGGSVVLIGSQSSVLPPRPPAGPQIAYASSKGALLTAMYCMARELGPERIRVNTVIPTWMWGPPVEGYVRAQAAERGVSTEAILEEILAPMAIKEMPADEDVAEAVIFLCSDRARTITGQTLLVNSGEHMP